MRSATLARAISIATQLTIAFAIVPARAQQAPDAGQVLHENASPRQVPLPSHEISVQLPASTLPAAGGKQVILQEVILADNTVFTDAQLHLVLGPVKGRSFDFAGLEALARRVSDHYHQAGFPFAQAYLPPQTMQNGRLRIVVVEGRYGQVKADGPGRLATRAQGFLAALTPASVIESHQLERSILILSDQPGIAIVPIMRPGQKTGTGDLLVKVKRDRPYSAEVGIDNRGNRYTGRYRTHVNLDINSPFLLGDQFSLSALYTDEHMCYGELGYSLPLGTSGLRGQLNYAHTYYELGKDFTSLNASGTAEVANAGVSYPLVRSQRLNLILSLNYQHKNLHDRQDATQTRSGKSSDVAQIALNFDLRDGWAGGGITYGALTWTPGNLSLGDNLVAVDSVSAHAAGHFDKLNLDMARLQSLTGPWTLYVHFGGQLARKNLDSSEEFGLGGADSVRAYPSGEGYGDQGWLAQAELRYSFGNLTPYLFFDQGKVTINKNPWSGSENHRSIAGGGGGMRYDAGHWRADLTLAWHTQGGPPHSDSQDTQPMIWAEMAYRF